MSLIHSKRNEIAAKIIVILSLAASAWLIRYFLIFIMADHWIGTLGMTTVLTGTITYLSYKDKLGWFGRAFMKILTHKLIQTYRKLSIIGSLFIVSVLLFGMVSIYLGNTQYEFERNSIAEKARGIPAIQKMTEFNPHQIANDPLNEGSEIMNGYIDGYNDLSKKITLGQALYAILLTPVMLYEHYGWFAGFIAWWDSQTHGMMYQIAQIFVIEEIEILIILFYQVHISKKILKKD